MFVEQNDEQKRIPHWPAHWHWSRTRHSSNTSIPHDSKINDESENIAECIGSCAGMPQTRTIKNPFSEFSAKTIEKRNRCTKFNF